MHNSLQTACLLELPNGLLYFYIFRLATGTARQKTVSCAPPHPQFSDVLAFYLYSLAGGESLLCKAALLSVPKTTRLHCQILPRCWCEVVWSMGLDWWGLGSKSLLSHKIHGDLAQVLDYPTSKGSFEDKMWLSRGRIYTPLNSLEKGNIQQCDPHMQTYALQHVTTENRDVHFLGMPSCASYMQDHVPNIFFLYKYFY